MAELDGKLDRLNADEIYAGMDRIANLIGDGHTYMKVPEDNANFPIDLERFRDEYRVVATTSGNEKALGTRVIKIQDIPIARVQELLLALTPADETQVLRDLRVLGFLTTGIFLHGMGIIPDRHPRRCARGKLKDKLDSRIQGAPVVSPETWRQLLVYLSA